MLSQKHLEIDQIKFLIKKNAKDFIYFLDGSDATGNTRSSFHGPSLLVLCLEHWVEKQPLTGDQTSISQ